MITIIGLVKNCAKVFTEEGFCYWNDGQRKLDKHAKSNQHKESIKQVCHGGDRSQPKIDVSLDLSIKTSRDQNRTIMKHVIQALKLLSRQNLAFRGSHTPDSEFNEHNSNLIQVSNLNFYFLEK